MDHLIKSYAPIKEKIGFKIVYKYSSDTNDIKWPLYKKLRDRYFDKKGNLNKKKQRVKNILK